VSVVPADADLMAAATEAERAAPMPCRVYSPALTALLRAAGERKTDRMTLETRSVVGSARE